MTAFSNGLIQLADSRLWAHRRTLRGVNYTHPNWASGLLSELRDEKTKVRRTWKEHIVEVTERESSGTGEVRRLSSRTKRRMAPYDCPWKTQRAWLFKKNLESKFFDSLRHPRQPANDCPPICSALQIHLQQNTWALGFHQPIAFIVSKSRHILRVPLVGQCSSHTWMGSQILRSPRPFRVYPSLVRKIIFHKFMATD